MVFILALIRYPYQIMNVKFYKPQFRLIKRTIITSTLILALLFSVTIGNQTSNSVSAQTYSNITIKSDGSIEGTDQIQRQGSIYTLTDDIFGAITVKKAGITIDGAGHTLQGNPREANLRGINLVGHDETFNAYGNVLVKNLRIYNFLEGIYTPSNNNSFIGNFFDNTRIHIVGGSGGGNLVKYNIFNNSEIFIDYNQGGNDLITENNFINSWIFVDLAKPPIVDKNYWSNYTAEYPDSKEVNDSGIWDTPYVYDKFIGGSHGDYPCIDYHPLINPVTNFEAFDYEHLFPSATPTLTQQTTTSENPEPPEIEPFLTTLVIASIVSAVAISISLLVYFKNISILSRKLLRNRRIRQRLDLLCAFST